MWGSTMTDNGIVRCGHCGMGQVISKCCAMADLRETIDLMRERGGCVSEAEARCQCCRPARSGCSGPLAWVPCPRCLWRERWRRIRVAARHGRANDVIQFRPSDYPALECLNARQLAEYLEGENV